MTDSRKTYNDGRGSGGSGTGRYGRGRGRGHPGRQGGESYQGVRGRGQAGIAMYGGYENRENEYVARGRGSGGHRGGGGRGHNYENRYAQSEGGLAKYYQGGGRGRGHDGYNNQPPVRGSHEGGPNHTVAQQQSPQHYHLSVAVGPAGKGAWTGRPRGRRSLSPSSSTAQPLTVSLPQSQTRTHVPRGRDGFRISCAISINIFCKLMIPISIIFIVAFTNYTRISKMSSSLFEEHLLHHSQR